MNSERLKILLEQLEQGENDPFISYGIAMEYLSAGDSEKAHNYLTNTIDNHPDYLPTYYQLATILEELDELEQAIEILQKGIKVAESQNELKIGDELSGLLKNILLELD